LLFDVLTQYLDSRPAGRDQTVRAMPEYRLPVDPAQMFFEISPD
jgi:hypothetical protein